MNKVLILIVLFASEIAFGESDEQRMVSMNDTTEKPYIIGSVFYKEGEDIPFTGLLYGKYPNGNFLSIQEYVNGIGNGTWKNFYSNGTLKEIGHYTNNRVEGPIKQYHFNGQIKAIGTYAHWRKKIGPWKYFNKSGELVETINHDTYQ